MLTILKKFFNTLFKDPNAQYLTPAMKKKRKKLSRLTMLFYSGFSFLFLSQVFIILSFKFQLFDSAEGDLQLSGWIFLVIILMLYFGSKKILLKLKKITESSKSVWIDQLFVIVPLMIVLGLTVFIHIRIGEVIYVLSHILLARIIWAPLHVFYLRASRKLEIFDANIDKHVSKRSQTDFEKEFGVID